MSHAIFHQILESERIFKNRLVTLTEKQEALKSLEKKVKACVAKRKTLELQCRDNKLTIQHQKSLNEVVAKRVKLLENALNMIVVETQKEKDTLKCLKRKISEKYDDLTKNIAFEVSEIYKTRNDLKPICQDTYAYFTSKQALLKGLQDEIHAMQNNISIENCKNDELKIEIEKALVQRDSKMFALAKHSEMLKNFCYSHEEQSNLEHLRKTLQFFERELLRLSHENLRFGKNNQSVVNTCNSRFPSDDKPISNVVNGCSTYEGANSCKYFNESLRPTQFTSLDQIAYSGSGSNERFVVRHSCYPTTSNVNQSDDEYMFDDIDIDKIDVPSTET